MAFFSQMNLDKEQVNNYCNKTARFHTADDYFLHEFLDFPQLSPEVVSGGLCSLRKESDCWENANQMSISAECKSPINTANGLSVGNLMKFCFIGPHPEETVNSFVLQHAVSPPDDLSALVFNTFDAFDYIEESGSSVTMGSKCMDNDFPSGKLGSSVQCFGHSGCSFESADVQSACQGDRKLANCHAEHLPSMNYCSWPAENLYTDLTSQNNRFQTAKTVVDEKVKYDTGNEGINLSNCSLMTQENNMKIPKEESCDTTTFSANTFVSLPNVNVEACSSSQNREYTSHLDKSSTLLIGALDYKSENSTQIDMNMSALQQGTRSVGNTQLVERHVQTVNQGEDKKSTYRKMSEMSFLSLHQQTKLSLSTNLTNDQQNARSQRLEFRNVMPTSCRVNTSTEHECTTIQMPSPLPVQTLSDVTVSQLFSAHSDLQNANCQYYRLQNVMPLPCRNKAATEQEYTTSYLQQLSSESKTSSQLFSTCITNDQQNARSQCFEFQNMPVSKRINTATEHVCTVHFPPNMPISKGINTAAENEGSVQSPSEDTSSSQLFSANITNDLHDAVTQCCELKNIMPLSRRINTAKEQVCTLQSPSESIANLELFSAHMLNDQQNTKSQCCEFQNIHTSSKVNPLTESECTEHVEQLPSENAFNSHLSAYKTSDPQNPNSPCYKLQGTMLKASRLNAPAEHECTEHAEKSSEIITDSYFSHLQGNKQKKINSLASKSKTYMKVGKRGCYVILPVNKVNQLMVRDLLSMSGNKEEASIKTMTEDFRNNKRRMLEQKLKRLHHIK